MAKVSNTLSHGGLLSSLIVLRSIFEIPYALNTLKHVERRAEQSLEVKDVQCSATVPDDELIRNTAFQWYILLTTLSSSHAPEWLSRLCCIHAIRMVVFVAGEHASVRRLRGKCRSWRLIIVQLVVSIRELVRWDFLCCAIFASVFDGGRFSITMIILCELPVVTNFVKTTMTSSVEGLTCPCGDELNILRAELSLFVSIDGKTRARPPNSLLDFKSAVPVEVNREGLHTMQG